MEEQSPEIPSESPSFEKTSLDMRSVARIGIEAAQKMGYIFTKVTREILGMIFK